MSACAWEEQVGQMPPWAEDPQPAVTEDKKPKQKLATEDDGKLGPGPLAARHFFAFNGVWFHEEAKEWQSDFICKNPKCKGKHVPQPVSRGYTNITNHCTAGKCMGKQAFDDAINQLKKGKGQQNIWQYYAKYTPKEKDVNDYLECIIDGSMPLSMVTNDLWRDKLKCGKSKIGKDSLRKIIANLTDIVLEKVKNILPDHFGLMMDAWTRLATHYLAVFATFLSNNGKLQVSNNTFVWFVHVHVTLPFNSLYYSQLNCLSCLSIKGGVAVHESPND
jgi:hypothetical protein